MTTISARIDAESAAFEAHARSQNQGELDALIERMAAAARPMGERGKQMDVLAVRMEPERRTADKAMRALLDAARARGLARPVPRTCPPTHCTSIPPPRTAGPPPGRPPPGQACPS